MYAKLINDNYLFGMMSHSMNTTTDIEIGTKLEKKRKISFIISYPVEKFSEIITKNIMKLNNNLQ